MKNKILSSIILILILLSSTFVYATDEEIPTKYDLRDEINIKVENQGNKDWCSYYAETKMIETYLQKTKGLSYDLSEGYLANWSKFNGTYGKQVLESDFPTKEYIVNETNQKKFNEATSKAVVNSFEYEMSFDKNVETVKKYIINYGGAFATIKCDKQMDNYKGGIYSSNEITESRGIHGVVIIGWDNNYSKDNFVYEKPETDGAWLILNSWGSNWGNNGTAWVSYENCNNLLSNCYGIESLTLANGEIIETKLEDEKQETTEIPVIEQQEVKETNKINDVQNIFIVIFAVACILLIIGLILNLKRHKK